MIPVVCKLQTASLDDLVTIDGQPGGLGWSKDLFKNEFENRCSIIRGVRLAGSLVGFIIAQAVIDEAHIMNFTVHPAMRGKGAGKALLKELLQELYAQAIGRVTLEVRRGNTVAQNLYESFGFAAVGVRPGYYRQTGEDAIVLALDVQDFVDRTEQ